MHEHLINEHNTSLSFISFVLLFSRLSEMEKDIVIKIVDKHTILVSYKYQAERQDTKKY